jgi:hypothetical protein
MIALELSGVHIGKTVQLTYKFPSWPEKRAYSVVKVKVWSLLHTEVGKVKIKPSEYGAAVWVPFNAEVEFI